ncbi:hypothetical protein ACROYT_G008907 [Oculina patagonica]
MSVLPSVVVQATAKHTASLIFLHGLGDTGHGWSANFESIKMPHVKCICPNAPVNPVTLNGGFRMPTWFDIASLSFTGGEDEKGIKDAAVNIKSIIEEEIKNGIPADRIVLGGFSQGGGLALYTALTMEKSLAGILALSSWLPLHKSFPQAAKGNKDTPMLQCHGESDPVVNFAFGNMTSVLLKSFCSKHEFKQYPGLAHSSSLQEMHDVENWLKKVLPKTD